MAFGIGMNTHEGEEGGILGRQEEVACDCWFSSTGYTLPRYIKYQDGKGHIHGITNIRVKESGKKNFCGISFMEYCCQASEGEREYQFVLLFHLEECKWKIIWGGKGNL